ncbi:MAG: hypothetical protein ACTHK7_05510 [Aureliella sp.]
MRIPLYIQDNGTPNDRCSLVPLEGADQRKLEVNVPSGSRLVGEGEFTFLVTSDGRAHSASDLRFYCSSRIDGYSFAEDRDAPGRSPPRPGEE